MSTAPLMNPPRFWVLSAEQALKQVQGRESGLSSPEAAERLRVWGPNELAPPRRFEALREIVRYVLNPLVIILLLASGISAAFGQVASSVIVALMLVLSVALNFTQAYRSQRAAERLRQQVGQTAAVLRDGAFTPLAPWLGFTPLPPLFFGFLLFMVVTYLGLVEIVKRWFYRRYPT
ncbi:MAG TPA: cation-transporting P-type ATPase [Methylomirabilota bacterium]|nr:cation-transporting P-type ATPase [Methylomirabilota bacterium]